MTSKGYEVDDGRKYNIYTDSTHISPGVTHYNNPYPQNFHNSASNHQRYANPDNRHIVINQPVNQNVIINQRPKDYFEFALFACLCCFWPTGIAALFYAWNSRKASSRLDYNKGYDNGKCSRTFAIISVALGVMAICIGIIMLIVMIAFTPQPNRYIIIG